MKSGDHDITDVLMLLRGRDWRVTITCNKCDRVLTLGGDEDSARLAEAMRRCPRCHSYDLQKRLSVLPPSRPSPLLIAGIIAAACTLCLAVPMTIKGYPVMMTVTATLIMIALVAVTIGLVKTLVLSSSSPGVGAAVVFLIVLVTAVLAAAALEQQFMSEKNERHKVTSKGGKR